MPEGAAGGRNHPDCLPKSQLLLNEAFTNLDLVQQNVFNKADGLTALMRGHDLNHSLPCLPGMTAQRWCPAASGCFTTGDPERGCAVPFGRLMVTGLPFLTSLT
ncbi:hypothetical protein EB241_04960 [Erwinia psidii]|uniref:Uncharacterized protein n=1 Tax=Erwinia psidii TaxID=69224 RepID=A0A3N6SCJ3_9GAMM|nr:hypothetical protein EB241_04960 [Erwinia psidii]